MHEARQSQRFSRRGLGGMVLCSAVLLLGGIAAARPRKRGEALSVVVARNSSLFGLSTYQLKQIYLGEDLRAPNGERILPLNRGANTMERVGFDRSVLGMNPEEVARYWIDRRIRGRTGSPKAIDPAGLLQKVVVRLPGSIAYVRASEVSPEVRVLPIDGRTPGDWGYEITTRTSAPRAAGD